MDMHAVPFVDAHVHYWDLAKLRYPWLQPPFTNEGPNGSVERIARTYLPGEYTAEASRWNVVGAVHIEAGADPADAQSETVWLTQQQAVTGLPTAIVAYADLADPEIDAVLARQAAHATARGIRQIVNWHPDARLSYSARDLTLDDAWQAGFAALGRHNLSFDLQCYPAQMPRIAELLAHHPTIPVVINHLGMPVVNDPDGLTEWRTGISALAKLDHVSIKLSGLGFIDREWDVEMTIPLIREVISLFGPGRSLAASDFPTDRLFAEFDGVMGALARAVDIYGDDDVRLIWGGNACRIYRLDPAIVGNVT